MKIQLFDGYFIEPDPLNLALKQKYTGQSKDGKEREGERIIGYWGRGNLPGLIKRFCSLIEVPEGNDRIISMKEYANVVTQSHKRLESWLKENYERIQTDIERNPSGPE